MHVGIIHVLLHRLVWGVGNQFGLKNCLIVIHLNITDAQSGFFDLRGVGRVV